MANTPPDTPDLSADIEKAVQAEVADMNAKRPRPPMRFAKPEEPPPPTLAATLADPEPTIEAVPLPVIITAIAHHVEILADSLDQRLTRIERVLGIR